MYTKAIIVVLLAALLFFGCTSPSSGGNTTSTPGGSQGQPTGGQPAANQSGGQPAANQSGGQPAANQSGGQPSGGQPSGGQPSGGDLVGKTFEQLAALGVPIQCDITTSSGTVKLYKGTGSDMRTEMATSGGTCPVMVSIVKGDKYYVGCEQGVLMPGSTCQWLVFSTTETAGAPTTYQKPDYSSVSAAQISCLPWVLDESKLQAPDNACSLQDLIKIPSTG